MDSSDTGSSDQGSSNQGSSDNGSSDPASSEQGFSAAHDAGATSGSAADKAQAAEAAKPRPGSSLILIPPATRNTDGPQAGATHGGDDAAAAAFTTGRGAKWAFFKRDWLRYGVPAALGLGLFGAGLAMGGQFFGTMAAGNSTAMGGSAKVAQIAADQAEIRHLTKKLGDEIHALQTRVEALHTAAPATTLDDIHGMKKSLDGLRASLDATKAETSASIAQLNAKVDHLQHDEVTAQPPLDKTSRSDSAAATTATSASVMHATPAPAHAATPAVQTALASPAVPKTATPPVAPAADPKKKPQMLYNWVVRDVYQGVALVDGPEGSIEVVRGDLIPGAGTVQSIERKNGGWIITTSRGIVASVRD
jgi:hypothetical protein